MWRYREGCGDIERGVEIDYRKMEVESAMEVDVKNVIEQVCQGVKREAL